MLRPDVITAASDRAPFFTCLGILNHWHDAEDCAADAVVELVQREGEVRSPKPWLRAVARQKALLLERRRLKMCPLPANCPAPCSESCVDCEAVQREVARLPAVLRIPLLLCDSEDLSRCEAAARIGCTEQQLKGRLERGRKLLRLRLAEALP